MLALCSSEKIRLPETQKFEDVKSNQNVLSAE